MKKDTFILLLLIFSVGLLVPLSVQKQTVNVNSNQEISVVYNLHSPTLQLTADKITNIAINISLIDDSGNEAKEILNQGTLQNKLEIDDLDPGLYQISFFSLDIVRVDIQGKGLYLSSMVIIGVLVLISLVLIYFKYND